MTEELLRRLDSLGRESGRSRSALVRDAVERYVARESRAEKDRRFAEAYKRHPVDELRTWNELAARTLVEEESW